MQAERDTFFLLFPTDTKALATFFWQSPTSHFLFALHIPLRKPNPRYHVKRPEVTTDLVQTLDPSSAPPFPEKVSFLRMETTDVKRYLGGGLWLSLSTPCTWGSESLPSEKHSESLSWYPFYWLTAFLSLLFSLLCSSLRADSAQVIWSGLLLFHKKLRLLKANSSSSHRREAVNALWVPC